MSVILHLSDPHFGTEQPHVTAALLQLAQELRPDIAILSGDITQRAKRGQFAAARSFMDALAAPVKLVIPGNHDIPLFNLFARIFNPYGNYRRVFGKQLEPQFSNKDALVIGVNATRPWRHADGEVSAKQIERVAQQLRGALPEQLRIVAVHQPVYVERESDLENLLHGHQQAIKAWAAAGADLILSGHIHLAYIRNLAEETDGLTRSVWTLSAGTAISSRIREGKPNSVNLIRYEPEASSRHCQVERLDFDAATARFITAHTQVLALS